MILFGVELPLLVRIAICVALATASAASVRSTVLLRGPQGVHSLEWSRDGELRAAQGPGRVFVPVTLGGGSFRFGTGLLVLWLNTPSGTHGIFIAGFVQDPRAFRGLCRRLQWPASSASGRPPPSAVTIGPKV
jgi:hypothetical protein